MDKKFSQFTPRNPLVGNESFAGIIPGDNIISDINAILNYVGVNISGFILLYDTNANWTAANLTIPEGFITIESDSLTTFPKFKIPDGITAWNDLPYVGLNSLGITLNVNNHTDNIDITSPDTNSILSIVDGKVKMSYSASGNTGNFESDDNGSYMIFNDGVNYASIIQTPNETTYSHSSLNKFISPLNQFGTILTIDETAETLDIKTGTAIYYGGVLSDGFMSITGYNSLAGDKGYNIDSIFTDTVSGISSSAQILQFTGSGNSGLQFISNWSNGVVSKDVNFLLDSFNETVLLDTSGVLNLGTAGSTAINIGNAGATVNILGTALYEYVGNQYVLDKCITLNYNGAVSSGVGVGFEIEENNTITGYFKTNAARNGFSILTPSISYSADLKLNLLNANREYSLPNTDGVIALLSDVTAMVTDAITDGVTNIAPSQNAVHDALLLKQDVANILDISLLCIVNGWAPGYTINVKKITNGKMVSVFGIIDGTSNAATTGINIPFSSGTNAMLTYQQCRIMNNGIIQTTPGMCAIGTASNAISFFTNWGTSTFSASNQKRVQFKIDFEID